MRGAAHEHERGPGRSHAQRRRVPGSLAPAGIHPSGQARRFRAHRCTEVSKGNLV